MGPSFSKNPLEGEGYQVIRHWQASEKTHQWGGFSLKAMKKPIPMSFWPRFFDCFPIYEPTSSDLGPLAKGRECWDFAGIPKATGEEFITSLAVQC